MQVEPSVAIFIDQENPCYLWIKVRVECPQNDCANP